MQSINKIRAPEGGPVLFYKLTKALTLEKGSFQTGTEQTEITTEKNIFRSSN